MDNPLVSPVSRRRDLIKLGGVAVAGGRPMAAWLDR